MCAIPDTLLTLLVATSTAVVTALATGLLITPRMEARKKRLGDVHAARDAFRTHMSRIASACALLRQVPPPADDEPGWTPVMRQRLAGERERWWQQLDESTRRLIDNVAAYAESWGPHMLVGLAVQYASNARMVALSERQEARKAELLIALTLPAGAAPVLRLALGPGTARHRRPPVLHADDRPHQHLHHRPVGSWVRLGCRGGLRWGCRDSAVTVREPLLGTSRLIS